MASDNREEHKEHRDDESITYVRHTPRWWEAWTTPAAFLILLGGITWGVQLNFAVVQNLKDTSNNTTNIAKIVELQQQNSRAIAELVILQRENRRDIDYQSGRDSRLDQYRYPSQRSTPNGRTD